MSRCLGPIDEIRLGQLDSSLKKNSAFVKRLRSVTAETLESILRDLALLKLSNYVSEAAVALAECRLRNAADIAAVVEVACAIHQAYREFRKPYLEALERETTATLVTVPSEELPAWLVRQRQLLRLLAELNLVAFIESASPVFLLLRKLLPEDDVRGPLHLPLVTSFVRAVGSFYLEASDDAATDQHQPPSPCPLVSAEWRRKFTEAIHHYFKVMCRLLARSHAKLQSMEARSRHHYETRGDLSAGHAADLQTSVEAVERLRSNLQALADLLCLSLPMLAKVEAPKVLEGKIVFADPTLGKTEGRGPVIFDSEEDRSFYEDLLDLAERVPLSLLLYGASATTTATTTSASGIPSPTPAEGATGRGGGEEAEEIDFSQVTDVDPEAVASRPIDESVVGEDLKSAGNIQAFFERLPAMQSRASADQAAVDFCYINSKATRRRLAQTLMSLPVRRLDMLPFIGRLLATLKPYVPEVVAEINQSLLGQFIFLFHRREPILGTRSRICRFIGELTKFRVMPQTSAYSMLKKCIVEDLTTYHIDMTAIILESCGRFLFHQPESHRRLLNLFEVIQRKRGKGMDITHVVMLDNAMYICNPPQVMVRTKARKAPRLAYLLHLIRTELNGANAAEVFKRIRRFPWDEAECQDELMRAFLKVWKIKYSSIPLLASMLGTLRKLYPAFVVDLVDRLLEEILDCLAANLAKNNHKSLAAVKFAGELFCFEVLEADTIFYLLHLLVTFGHGGVARISAPCPIDGPEEGLRIRLVCTLLQTCGGFLRGAEQMEGFLRLFEYYVSTKTALAMEVDYLLDDTFDHLCRERPPRELRRAVRRLNEVTGDKFAFLWADLGADSGQEGGEGTTTAASGTSHGGGGLYRSAAVAAAVAEEQERAARMYAKQMDEFDRALSGMLTSGLEERKLERKVGAFDAPLPLTLLSPASPSPPTQPREIRMLVKKRNRTVTRILPVDPSHVSFVAQAMAGREAEAEEAKIVQRLVLESLREERGGGTRGDHGGTGGGSKGVKHRR